MAPSEGAADDARAEAGSREGAERWTGPAPPVLRIDRLEDRRHEPGILTAETRVYPIRDHHALVSEGAPFSERLGDLVAGGSVDASPAGSVPVVLLGEREGVRYAARPVGEADAAGLERRTGGRFESLRTAAALVPDWQRALLAFGAALLAWHGRTRFCGRCGAPTRIRKAGHLRVCGDEACGGVEFPRTDPAIITLIRRDQRALLVHQPAWPSGRLSTLAGFVEPGERLEEAVAREISEEVGLRVTRLEYFGSQPWPFPHTLMVGYRTDVGPGRFRLGDELDEARWFTRADLLEALEAGTVTIPAPLSLSRALIDDWLGG